jgi:hypothetical protein
MRHPASLHWIQFNVVANLLEPLQMISYDPGDLILPQVDRSHSSAVQQPIQCDESLTAGKMLRQEGAALRQAP